MRASDGKKRFTDVADTAQLLRIIQSVEEQTGKPVITGDNAAQLNRVVTDLIEDVSGRAAGDTEDQKSEK